MSKTIEQRVEEAVQIINTGGPDFITEATGALLNYEPGAGAKVVLIGDTILGIEGNFGTVVGPSKNKLGGFVDVRTPGGTVVQAQTNLLVPV